jgi:serine/threonine protein kinase
MKYSEGLPTGYSTLWINASSRNALVRSFLQIAKMLHPFIKKGGESYDQLSVIRELLEDSKYGPWLMVLDGADDKDIFLEEKNGMPAIGDFIPKAPHGRVLITTTDSRIVGLGDGALIPIQNGINLSTLSLGHGVELLRNSVPDELHQGLGLSDQSKCERLAGLLDCLPIALGHASAQIRTDQITLDDYIGDYISMQRSMDFGNLGETPQAGFVTFELSYQRLLQNSDLSMKSPAARLLDLMAFFDSRCVSKTYLQRVFKDEIDSDHPFKLAIGRLLNLSLVHRNSELEEFWMLSIVQNWVYQRLSHEEKLQYIKIAKDAWTKTASDISSRTLANRREYDIQNLPSLALDRDRHYHYERQTDVPFRPLRLLGEGAFGEVVEVEKISGTFKGKKFARKKLKMRLGHHPEEIEREVTILRRLQHRHIIELVSTYDTEQTFAIIMLPVAECNLSDYMDQTQESNMPGNMLSPMTRWFGCLTEAIAYIHSHNIIMRDLKPGNILVSNLEVILTDFGTATLHDDFHDDWDITMGKISEDESPDRIARESLSITSSTVRSRHLRTYAYYVTSVYTAPDALFYRQDRRFSSLKMQDIFGLGCVFLEIVTVLLGESINEFVLYRRNDRGGYDYSSNMENLLRWIMYLSAKYDKTDERSGSCSGDGHGSSGKGFCTSCLAKNALQWCFLMLQPRSEDRCSAEDLIYRLSASHLTISCVHCKPKLFLHERFLDRIHIPKVLVTAALRSDNAITWTIANKTWIERGAPQIETQVQQIGAVN